MANLTLTPTWTPVYQLELTDPVQAGPGGIDNLQAQQLGDRTEWLKAQVEFGDVAAFTVPAAASAPLSVMQFDTPVNVFYHMALEFLKPVAGGALIAHWETLFVFKGVGFSPSSESIKLGESVGLALDLAVVDGAGNKPTLSVKMAAGVAVAGVVLRYRVKRILPP